VLDQLKFKNHLFLKKNQTSMKPYVLKLIV